jgi:hypothetical protein
VKKTYQFIQMNAIALVVWFGICPYLPSALFNTDGAQWVVLYCVFLLISSSAVFLLCALWLLLKFRLQKPGYMWAVTIGSLLGILIGASALLGLYGYGTGLYMFWRGTPALLQTLAMLVGVYLQLAELRT